MYKLRPGVWYLLYFCQGCKTKQILFPDLSEGKSKIIATYAVACPHCGHRGSYDSENIERYQHRATAKLAAA